jgi:hypothetical protein
MNGFYIEICILCVSRFKRKGHPIAKPYQRIERRLSFHALFSLCLCPLLSRWAFLLKWSMGRITYEPQLSPASQTNKKQVPWAASEANTKRTIPCPTRGGGVGTLSVRVDCIPSGYYKRWMICGMSVHLFCSLRTRRKGYFFFAWSSFFLLFEFFIQQPILKSWVDRSQDTYKHTFKKRTG